MGVTLATIVWRWLKKRKFVIKRWPIGTMKSGVLFCTAPAKSCGVRFPHGLGITVQPAGADYVRIEKFQKRSNSWRLWIVKASDPDFFDKLEYHIKSKTVK